MAMLAAIPSCRCEWRAKGEPVAVNVHDFPGDALGKAIPCGICDIHQDTGFVNVGIDRETAQFAAASIRAWWQQHELAAVQIQRDPFHPEWNYKITPRNQRSNH